MFDPKQNFNGLNTYVNVLYPTTRNSSFSQRHKAVDLDVASSLIGAAHGNLPPPAAFCRVSASALRVIGAFSKHKFEQKSTQSRKDIPPLAFYDAHFSFSVLRVSSTPLCDVCCTVCGSAALKATKQVSKGEQRENTTTTMSLEVKEKYAHIQGVHIIFLGGVV